MGKSGTELAKEASDIVLDDNFESIVKAVSWGRFFQFQLTANIVTLFISFISAAILHDTPFKAAAILHDTPFKAWINLIMDSLGALALATGRPHPSLLNRRPQRRSDSLISPFMVQNIPGQCVFQIIAVAIVLLFPDLFSSSKVEVRSLHHYTLLFNAFVYSQMFNLFNARVVEMRDSEIAGISDNMIFLGIMSLIGGVEIILVFMCSIINKRIVIITFNWCF